jgi:hypothetical protein
VTQALFVSFVFNMCYKAKDVHACHEYYVNCAVSKNGSILDIAEITEICDHRQMLCDDDGICVTSLKRSKK